MEKDVGMEWGLDGLKEGARATLVSSLLKLKPKSTVCILYFEA